MQVFTFVFFQNGFSQIYITDSSALSISDKAFISTPENRIPTKIYLSANAFVTNTEALSNVVIIKSKNPDSVGLKPSALAKKVFDKETHSKKYDRITTDGKIKSDYTFLDSNSQKTFISLSGNCNTIGIAPYFFHTEGIIPYEEEKTIQNSGAFKNSTFYNENSYNKIISFNHRVRPPPIS